MSRAVVEPFGHGRVPVPLARFMELMQTPVARDLVQRINRLASSLTSLPPLTAIPSPRFTQKMEAVRSPDAAKDTRLVQVHSVTAVPRGLSMPV